MNNKSQRYGVDPAACKKQDWQTRLLLAGNKLQAPQQRIKLEESGLEIMDGPEGQTANWR